jgi:signal transduction histidine kinase
VQEALNNIRKHAQATAASLIIELVDDETIRIGIVDNGCGFDVEAALRRPPGQSGIGLRGMIERTVNAGGTIDVASQPGQGTRITILLPRG